jgi:hypothetical protein
MSLPDNIKSTRNFLVVGRHQWRQHQSDTKAAAGKAVDVA